MPKESKEETYELPEPVLKQGVVDTRKRFFEDFDSEKEHYELEFVEKIRVDDDLLARYVWNQTGNVDKAVDQLKGTAKWRKDFGTNDLNISSLNQELLKISLIYPSKWDKNGHTIMMLAVRRVTRDSSTNSDKQKIVIFLAEFILKKSVDQKLTFFIDCNGVGVSNMDLEMMVFITNALLKYYPNCLGYVLVYNMPRIFNVIWQVIKSMLPKHYRQKVKFVNKETVREFVNPECLPERMGGQVPDFYDFEKIDDLEDENFSKLL